MSFNRLRSHEDLSDYLDVLNDVYDSFDDPSNLIPSFSQDPHEVVQDMLSQLVNTRKKGLEIIKIAKKFYKAQSDSALNNQSLVKEILSLQSEINTLISKVSSQTKEIDSKDDRISTMSHELHETEKEYRGLLIEVEQLRKNLKTFKERKSSPKVKPRISLLKAKEDNEEQVKSLNSVIEEYKDELLRKAVEIDELNLKVKSLEDEVVAEKMNADKSRTVANSSKKENFDLIDRIEELQYQLEAKKSQVLRLEHELIKEKSHGENIIKQYERERSVSIASNFGTNSEFISIRSNFGTGNEFFSISSNYGTNNEPIKLDADAEALEKGQNLPTYKKNAPRMETLGDWMEEENDYVEDIKPKPMLSKQPTMFVLSSPVVNYDRKFQFPDLNQKFLDMENGEQINIIQKKKNSSKATFDLKKRTKKKVFTFDDDENHDNITPLQGLREDSLTVQAFKGISGGNILSPFKKLEICKVNGMNKFCEPRLRDWKLGFERLVNGRIELKGKNKPKLDCKIGESIRVLPKVQKIDKTVAPGFIYKSLCKSALQESKVSVKATKKFKLSAFSQPEMNILCKPQNKPKLDCKIGESIRVLPKVQKIDKTVVPGFIYKSVCKSVLQESKVSVKKTEKFTLSAFSQQEMSILCKPQNKKALALIQQKHSTVNIKPLQKPKLIDIRESSFSISSKVAKISLCFTKSISIQQLCSTSAQEGNISIKRPKKLFSFCDQPKMGLFCEPRFKSKNLKVEKIFNGEVEIKAKAKAKLFNWFESSLEVIAKVQKIEVSLAPGFMLKSNCNTSIQGSGILVSKNPKFKLSASYIKDMNMHCKPNIKKPLVLIQEKHSNIHIKPLQRPKLNEFMESSLAIKPEIPKISLCISSNFSIKHFCSTSIQKDHILIQKPKKLITLCDQPRMSTFCEPRFKNTNFKIERIINCRVEIEPKVKGKLFNTLESTIAVIARVQKIDVSLLQGFMYKSECRASIQEAKISIKSFKKFHLTMSTPHEMNKFCYPNPKPQLETRPEISLSLISPVKPYTLFTYSFKKPSVYLSTSSLPMHSIRPNPKPELKLQQQPSLFTKSSQKRFYITFESTLGIPKQSLNLNFTSFRSLSTIKSLNLDSQNSIRTFPILKNQKFSVSKQMGESIKKSTQKVEIEITGSFSRFCSPGVTMEFSSGIKPQKMGYLEIEVQKNVYIQQKNKNKEFGFSFEADLSVVVNRPILALRCYPGSKMKKKLSVFIDPVMSHTITKRKVAVLTEQVVQSLGLIRKKPKMLEDVLEFNLGIQAKPKNCKVENYGILSISPTKRLLQVSAQISQSVDKIKPNVVFEAVQNLNRMHNLGISKCNTIGIVKLRKIKLRIKRQEEIYVEKKIKQSEWSQTDEIIDKFVADSFIIKSKLKILHQKNSFLIKCPEKLLNFSEQVAIALPQKMKNSSSTQISDDLLLSFRNQGLITDAQLPITVFPDKTENIALKNPTFPPKIFSLSIQRNPSFLIKNSERPYLKYSIQDSLEIFPSITDSSQISDISSTNHSINSLNKSWTIVSTPDISIKRLRKNLDIVYSEKIVLTGLKRLEPRLGIHPVLNIQSTNYESLQITSSSLKNKQVTKQKRTQELDTCKIYSMMLIPCYSVLKGSGRESKMDFGSQRDPIKDFFILVRNI